MNKIKGMTLISKESLIETEAIVVRPIGKTFLFQDDDANRKESILKAATSVNIATAKWGKIPDSRHARHTGNGCIQSGIGKRTPKNGEVVRNHKLTRY